MNNEELLNAPPLAEQFPIEFGNGFKISTILFWCTFCYAVAPLTRVHGHISRIVEGVADITAATRCPCGEITRYRIRLLDDNTFSYLEGNHWISKTNVIPLSKRIARNIKTKFILYSLRLKYYRLRRQARKLQKILKQ
jgi:hypothetical protein